MNGDRPVTTPWSRLTILNDMRYLPMALSYVHDFGLVSGVGPEALQRLELAVDEAVSNVIEHAFDADETASFDVVCRALSGGMEVAVQDRGLPFDPAQVGEWRPESVADAASGHGLGALLMRRLVDEFGYTNRGAEGKEVRLVVYSGASPVEPGALEEHEDTVLSGEGSRPSLTLRWMEPGEAVEAARCVYDSYGYSYANEHVYYPERVAAMNSQGSLRSAVAVTEAGEVAGHAALLIDDRQPPEMGMVATKKKHRGLGAASRLAVFLDQACVDSDYSGAQIKAVTVHPFTQLIVKKMGFTPCGFLLAHSPKTLSFKGIAEGLEQRNSDVIAFKQFRPPPGLKLYPPERHRDVVARIYERMGRPATYCEGRRRRPTGETRLIVSMNHARSLAVFYLERCGERAVEEIIDAVRRARGQEMRVIELFIDLGDPAAAWIVPRLEAHRFFFTGVMPGMAFGDALVMQHLEGVQVDYSGITVVEDFTKELLDYVRVLDAE